MTKQTERTERMTPGTQRARSLGIVAGRESFTYRGIVRDGSRIVWTCEHEHEYRDSHVYQWALIHGPRGAALTCSADHLAQAMPT